MDAARFQTRQAWLPEARENVFESIDDAQQFVADMFVDHSLEVISPTREFSFLAKTQWYGSSGLIFLDYSTHVQISPSPLQDFVLVQIPLTGTSTLRMGNHRIEASPIQASIPPQDQSSIMHWYPKSPHICVYVSQNRLDEVASEIYGVDEVQGIKLQPKMDLRTVEGQRFKQAIMDFHEDLQQPTNLGRMARLSEELLIGRLLAASRNSINQALNLWPQTPQIAESSARRNLAHSFRELLEKHCHEDVTIGDFAVRLNVSIRALQLAVAEEFESTPSGMLLEKRLEKIHLLLTDPDYLQCAISELAHRCGFTHQGRFSAAYKKRFGETPRETRRKI